MKEIKVLDQKDTLQIFYNRDHVMFKIRKGQIAEEQDIKLNRIELAKLVEELKMVLAEMTRKER